MFTISIALLLLTSSQIILGQFWRIGGGAGGYGCEGQVQHFGSECYQRKTGTEVLVCVGEITAILPNHSTLKMIMTFLFLF